MTPTTCSCGLLKLGPVTGFPGASMWMQCVECYDWIAVSVPDRADPLCAHCGKSWPCDMAGLLPHRRSREGSVTSERTVHAETERFQIVRYERSGKWFVESKVDARPPERVRVDTAAWRAVDAEEALGGTVYMERPGGRRFDQLVVRHRRTT